jgi:tetratricopeptide (TPR) repeat protein
MRRLAFVVLLLVAPPSVLSAAAQSGLDEAKAQYAAAAYEEALSTLTRLADGASVDRIEVEQYRALCLMALGNITEAERAVAAMVEADPIYMPSPSVASPKVLALISEIRSRQLPGVVRRLLDSGRTAYERKDLARARQHFELLLKLLDDPGMNEAPEKQNVRVLAQGFVTLLSAAAPESTREIQPATPNGDPVDAAAAPVGAASEAPAVPPAVGFFPAVPLLQTLPTWEPPTSASARTEYTGALTVRIGIDGKVKDAVIDRRSHPAYDARLLLAARSWLYKPATRNGQPVESERVIAISLRPPPR